MPLILLTCLTYNLILIVFLKDIESINEFASFKQNVAETVFDLKMLSLFLLSLIVL